MDPTEYAAMTQRLIADFTKNPTKYLTADMVAKDLLPLPRYDDANHGVMLEAIAHIKGVTPAKFEVAMRRRAKAMEKDAREQATEESRQAWQSLAAGEIGGAATDARSFIAGYMATQNVVIRYDMDCLVNGEKKLASEVENAAILTAEKLRYTLGNNRITTHTTLRLAFEEYISNARALRKQAVLDDILRPPDDPHVIQKFRDRLCQHIFVDPELGCRAVMKMIWQTKRRLLGLYVELLQMLVLYGPQGSGKSELLRNFIQAALGELAAECDMMQVNDDKNFQLRSNAALFVDEMAGTYGTDISKLKNLITAKDYTARIHYSHAAQKIPLTCTLIGTCDKRLNTLVRDVAGMRRFVEVDVKHRANQGDLDWQQDVVGFNWVDLWRAVDHTTVDPLMASPVGDKVRAHQEDMRARSNTEAWVECFHEETWPHGTMKQTSETTLEFFADKLYREVFRRYEENYHPGSKPTGLIIWTRTMKSLIEQGLAPNWEWRAVGHNVIYYYTRPKVTPLYGNGRDLVPVARPSKQQAR